MNRLTTLTLITAFAMPTLAHAGGPVLVEDMTETAPIVQDRDNLVPLILLGLVVGALVLGGGSDACQGPDDVPTPEPC